MFIKTEVTLCCVGDCVVLDTVLCWTLCCVGHCVVLDTVLCWRLCCVGDCVDIKCPERCLQWTWFLQLSSGTTGTTSLQQEEDMDGQEKDVFLWAAFNRNTTSKSVCAPSAQEGRVRKSEEEWGRVRKSRGRQRQGTRRKEEIFVSLFSRCFISSLEFYLCFLQCVYVSWLVR